MGQMTQSSARTWRTMFRIWKYGQKCYCLIGSLGLLVSYSLNFVWFITNLRVAAHILLPNKVGGEEWVRCYEMLSKKMR